MNPLGTVESLALPLQNCQLALTPGLLAQIYDARVSGALLADDGRYVHFGGDDNWWVLPGCIFYSPGASDTAAIELTYARQHFFLPHRYRDPFHTDAVPTESYVTYDAYDLLLADTRDAVGNPVAAGQRDTSGTLTTTGNDYRTLAVALTMDASRNRTAVAFDALGMVVGTAAMGKPEGPPARRSARRVRRRLWKTPSSRAISPTKNVDATSLPRGRGPPGDAWTTAIFAGVCASRVV